ncbi:TPA: hypothetical protein J1246_002029 [Escherichia coli]|nr:hypothetical protein [Escherichia coli]
MNSDSAPAAVPFVFKAACTAVNTYLDETGTPLDFKAACTAVNRDASTPDEEEDFKAACTAVNGSHRDERRKT